MKRLGQLGGFLLIGLALAWLSKVDVDAVAHSPWYKYFAFTLLAIGLYSGTYAISPASTRLDGKLILTAVTVGVVVKALLIGGVLALAFQNPVFLVLGVAVAQIDPLAVAALMGDTRISERARTILAAWSSFDDPITVLLTIYLATFLSLHHPSALGWLLSLSGNLALAAVTILLWHASKRLSSPPPNSPADDSTANGPAANDSVNESAASDQRLDGSTASDVAGRGSSSQRVAEWLGYLLLAVAVAIAIAMQWMLAVALIGFFCAPPRIARLIDRATAVALICATILLGLVLSGGVDPVPGIALGLTAYAAQMVVAWYLARRLPHRDRVHLSLAQQNGITAIILALALQIEIDFAVAVIAPAILVVNLTHLVANRIYDRRAAVRDLAP